MNSKYHYIEISKNGPADTLEINEGSFNEHLADGEILIDVKYSGINFADILMRLGLYRDAPKKPFIPGYELSGIVKAIGSSVTKFKVGDEVMAGTKFGGYVSKIILKDWQVLQIPSGLNLKEAAALPVNYITAYIAAHEFGRIRKDDRVLIDCATGGVGVVLMQLCEKVGAEVVGLTTSPAKKDFITSYGAKAYTFQEFANTDETNFDFILNSSGGKSLKAQYQRLSKSGKMCCIGLQSAVTDGKGNFFSKIKAAIASPWYPILKLVMESKSVSGFNALSYFDDEPWMQKHLPSMESTLVKPFIGEVFKAEEVARAHQTLEQKKTRGKVILEW